MSPSSDSKPDNYQMNAKICQLVEKCSFMYDRSHPQYLRKDVCDDAWLRIAQEMGESVSTCRERWRNIRTSFARSINTNKVPCSANRTKPYYLHEELKFLARHITPGVPVTRRYKRKATNGSGEDSELIEVSVGEDTFTGFDQLGCGAYGDNSETQQSHDASWARLEKHANGGSECEGEGEAEGVDNESCDSSLGNERLRGNSITGKTDDDGVGVGVCGDQHEQPACSRLARLPPPPLQAAPLSAFQRGLAETEAAAALHQIQMSSSLISPPLTKKSRMDVSTNFPSADHDERTQPQNPVDGFKLSANCGADVGGEASFLLELQTEIKVMDHRQKIHLKRRIYEALSEIYPITENPVTSTASAATMTNLSYGKTQAIAAGAVAGAESSVTNDHLMAEIRRVEKMCHDLSESLLGNNARSKETMSTVIVNGDSTYCLPEVAAPIPSKRTTNSTTRVRHNTRNATNEGSAVTRSTTAERRKPNSYQSGTVVKDEPEVVEGL